MGSLDSSVWLGGGNDLRLASNSDTRVVVALYQRGVTSSRSCAGTSTCWRARVPRPAGSSKAARGAGWTSGRCGTSCDLEGLRVGVCDCRLGQHA
eukprot:7388970-Prymnesium_polylepis.2